MNITTILALFLGCDPGEEEQKIQEAVEKTPAVLASVHPDQDFKSAFVDGAPSVEKTCFVYPFAEGAQPYHYRNPSYKLANHYRHSQTATLITNCSKTDADSPWSYIDFVLDGIDYAVDRVTKDNQRFATIQTRQLIRRHYVGNEDRSYLHVDLSAIDASVNAFCQTETANPHPCNFYAIKEPAPTVVREETIAKKQGCERSFFNNCGGDGDSHF